MSPVAELLHDRVVFARRCYVMCIIKQPGLIDRLSKGSVQSWQIHLRVHF